MILEELIARNMLSLDCFSQGNGHLTTQDMLAQCSWICLKPTMVRDLLITKLEAYDLDKTSLYLLIDYLSNRKQREKKGSVSVTRGMQFAGYYKDHF